MLAIVNIANLESYRRLIKHYSERYIARCWFVLYQADIRARLELGEGSVGSARRTMRGRRQPEGPRSSTRTSLGSTCGASSHSSTFFGAARSSSHACSSSPSSPPPPTPSTGTHLSAHRSAPSRTAAPSAAPRRSTGQPRRRTPPTASTASAAMVSSPRTAAALCCVPASKTARAPR